MRPRHLALALLPALSPAPLVACKCAASSPNGVSPRMLAEAIRKEDVVFEGKVQKVELKWRLLNAASGETVPADLEFDNPGMLVSFEVLRNYSDIGHKQVQLTTGLGGGDCGFPFEVGEQYLVDAFKEDSGELSTGICSHTALLEDSQQEIAYLRGDPEIPKPPATSLPHRTSQLCGHLVPDNGILPADGEVLLYRKGSNSLLPHGEGEPAANGSFCISDVRPGNYFMAFDNDPQGSPTSFVFFPGVAKLSDAQAIDVSEPQDISHLLFKIPSQKTFSVSGKIPNFTKAQQQAEPEVVLLSSDRFSLVLSYSQKITADGTFTFPQVLPGKYWAIVSVESSGDEQSKWSTRKVEIEVGASVRDLLLELFAN